MQTNQTLIFPFTIHSTIHQSQEWETENTGERKRNEGERKRNEGEMEREGKKDEGEKENEKVLTCKQFECWIQKHQILYQPGIVLYLIHLK